MSNVKDIWGKEVKTIATPDPELVKVLEEALSMAKEGQLQSFIGTGFMFDGLRFSVWCDTHENYYEMLGVLDSLRDEWVSQRGKITYA